MRRGSIVGASVVAVLVFGALQPAAGTAAASTKASSTSSSELANPHGRAAFKAGAAVESITPPRFGAVRDDRADCKPGSLDPRTFDGPRTFAFEEPYIDQANVGTYQLGDPFLDCNGNGRWDGILLGGGSDAPRFATTVADQVTARALVVSNHHQTIAVEVLDQEGLFNVYQERIRAQVSADGYHLDGIFISATHDESAPDTLGISGVSQTTSGVDAYYVDFLVNQSARAIERAYDARRPARIKYAEAIEPANLSQCFSSYPFVDDQLMPTLQAVATNGRVIATLGDVSQHAETLGFNPDPAQRNWISSDWPHFFRTELEGRYGGVGIEMAGSVGSNETPQVFPGPISRVPQQFVDASHPAGCRTLFQPNGTPAPVGYDQETKVLGEQLGGAVGDALSSSGVWSASDTIWGERRSVCVTLTNALFSIGAQLGVFAARPGYADNCTVEFPPAPNGATSGTELQSQVAAFRIGDGEFVSVPGEAFPFTYLRSFLGPNDMPNPQYALPAWVTTHMHAPYRFVDGLAEDMLGYIFPRGNGVGVPGENNSGGDTDRFGCGHSDDSEAASSQTGDIVGNALAGVLDSVEGAPENVTMGRYVLPDGTLSRDPQGQPGSIKCNVDTVFHATGPAVAVWLPGGPYGHVVVPAAWMSLSGRSQRQPDRNTRGWLDRDGTRHWLDVFPDPFAGGGAPRR
jgi:hypothetical protein